MTNCIPDCVVRGQAEKLALLVYDPTDHGSCCGGYGVGTVAPGCEEVSLEERNSITTGVT
jgi:hypothetical protein